MLNSSSTEEQSCWSGLPSVPSNHPNKHTTCCSPCRSQKMLLSIRPSHLKHRTKQLSARTDENEKLLCEPWTKDQNPEAYLVSDCKQEGYFSPLFFSPSLWEQKIKSRRPTVQCTEAWRNSQSLWLLPVPLDFMFLEEIYPWFSLQKGFSCEGFFMYTYMNIHTHTES